MKIAYLTTLNIHKYGGVVKKIKAQIDSWQKLGIQVKLVCVVPKIEDDDHFLFQGIDHILINEGNKLSVIIQTLKFIIGLNSTFDKVISELDSFAPDTVYFRNSYFLPYIAKIFNRYPSYLEINTNEHAEYKMLAKQTIKHKILYPYHAFTSMILLSKSKGVCFVTFELKEYYEREFSKALNTVKSIVVPNSIQLDDYFKDDIPPKPCKGSMISMVFLGTEGMPWHGVDKLVELAIKGKGELEIHVVGLRHEDYAPCSDNIKFYGHLQEKEYVKLLKEADIGIGTLALYRKEMIEACPLKVREYLAHGLPIIIGYEDTAFIKYGMPDWVLQIENNQNNIMNNLENILQFSRNNKGKKLSQADVRRFVDSNEIEKNRVEFIQNTYAE